MFELKLGPPETHLCLHDYVAATTVHAPNPRIVACPRHSMSWPTQGAAKEEVYQGGVEGFSEKFP